MPELIVKYHLDAVKKMKRNLKINVVEDGTEHSVIEPLHVHFSKVNIS